MTGEPTWEERVAAVWAEAADLEPGELLVRMRALAAERPAGDADAAFELAGAFDAAGDPAAAAPLYQQALDAGLTGRRRRQAVIQMASTLRNLGNPQRSAELLTAERAAGSDTLDDAVAAFLALALVDVGRPVEAVSLALSALAHHLPRYGRSLASYAALLVEGSEGGTAKLGG